MDETTEAWCTVPGHKEAGMVMAIEVTGSASSGGGGGGGVTHKFANVGKGALGLFQAGEVEAAGGGH